MFGGLKTLEILRRPGQYERLYATGEALMQAIGKCLGDGGYAHQVAGDTTLFDVVFTDQQVTNYRDIARADKKKAAAFNAGLRRNGILKPPAKFYPSMALTDDDVAQTIDAVAYAVQGL